MLRCTRSWLAPLRALTHDRVTDKKRHPLTPQTEIGEPFNPNFGFEHNKLVKFRARNSFHRQQILRRLCTDLVRRDHAIVAGARGPALRVVADSIVTFAKRGDQESRQQLAYFLNDPLLVDKAFDEYPRRFADYHGGYTMMTPLGAVRRKDNVRMWFIEFKNRAMSDNHKGEDYSRGPERFFLPPRVIETERGIVRPPHMQMAFDRWASKFKTAEFHSWWRERHTKMRYWGIRGVPHPAEVEPLWTEKDEEEWHSDLLASAGGGDASYDLDDAAPTSTPGGANPSLGS